MRQIRLPLLCTLCLPSTRQTAPLLGLITFARDELSSGGKGREHVARPDGSAGRKHSSLGMSLVWRWGWTDGQYFLTPIIILPPLLALLKPHLNIQPVACKHYLDGSDAGSTPGPTCQKALSALRHWYTLWYKHVGWKPGWTTMENSCLAGTEIRTPRAWFCNIQNNDVLEYNLVYDI